MSTVLEEVTELELTREHVERRVADWEHRIRALYHQIEGWLPAGYSARRHGTRLMHEIMMQKFEVAEKNLPILEILRGSAVAARIEPRGLWIIGINGRLDMFVGQVQYLIVDNAEIFAPPSWVFTAFSDQWNRQPLTQQTFCSLIEA